MKPRKVLAVDDSPVIHKIYGVLLRRFPLIHAHNGLEALDCLEEQEIDLILLDINMPQMNGLHFLKEMKSGPFQHIPVIVISGDKTEEMESRCLNAGAAAYMKKPPDTKKLLALIENL